jgi:hypothetical protein
MKKKLQCLFIAQAVFAGILFQPPTAFAQGTAFTYQGQLQNNGGPANGLYDFQFSLSNAPGGGGQIGGTVTNLAVGVTNGLFTTTLDFGNVFSGNPAWLAISVRTNGSGAYVGLNPLQPLTPAPYAMFATIASNVSGTVSAAQLPRSVVTNNASGLNLGGTFNGSLNGNAATSSVAYALFPGVSVTNAFITNSVFAGNAAGLTNLNAANLNGTISQASLGTSGSYSPTIGDGTYNFINTYDSGYYMKIGNLVYFEAFIGWSGKGSATSTSAVIISLPFPDVSTESSFTVGNVSGVTFNNEITALSGNNASYVELVSILNGGNASLIPVSSCSNTGGLISVSGFYRWQ